MADIKTRDAVKGTIKTIDKAAIATERMKSAYAKTKDKAEQGYYADESSATEYAADRLSYGADRIKDEGIHQFNKQGQKAVKETRENIGKAKDKISAYKQKKATKAAEQHNNGLQIRHGAASRSSAPDSVQRAKSQFIKTRQQGKKTVKTTARNAEKTVKATAKGTVKTTQKSVKTAQATSISISRSVTRPLMKWQTSTALMRNSDSSYPNYLPRKTIRSGLRCFTVSRLATAKS